MRRKIDSFLINWKSKEKCQPLIVKGARQIGKTYSIEKFAKTYSHLVEVNFATEPYYKTIFDNGFSVDEIIKQLSAINPKFQFVPHKTLIFFDELQACPNCATSLKPFDIDGRFDVICSGSLMGISYSEIESNSVGYKEEYEMHSLDFEEFLWAKGYTDEQIGDLYSYMRDMKPLPDAILEKMFGNFKEFMLTGGMPAVVKQFVKQGNFSGILKIQKKLLLDYEEDITKYAIGIDKAKVRNIYMHIPVYLAKDNKKFQISKVAKGARNREYVGTVDWLCDAGIVNICYYLDSLELPLKGNYNPNNYKVYYHDTGLLVASMEDEAQIDLFRNRNFNTYKGAIYENVVGEMLVKAGFGLYCYKNEKSTVEMDFFVRDAETLIPVEVKATDNATKSLVKLIKQNDDIKYGIKLCYKNIGFNGQFYTFPYFLTFLIKRFIDERICKG